MAWRGTSAGLTFNSACSGSSGSCTLGRYRGGGPLYRPPYGMAALVEDKDRKPTGYSSLY